MSETWVLVDGYSVLHAWPGLRQRSGRSWEKQRDMLTRLLQQYADQTGHHVTVVFDGYGSKQKLAPVVTGAGIEVIFSDPGKTADDVIERLVAQAAQRQQIRVVTSDNVERQVVEGLGAASISAEGFEQECRIVMRELDGTVRSHGYRPCLGRLGERFFEAMS